MAESCVWHMVGVIVGVVVSILQTVLLVLERKTHRRLFRLLPPTLLTGMGEGGGKILQPKGLQCGCLFHSPMSPSPMTAPLSCVHWGPSALLLSLTSKCGVFKVREIF